MPWRVWRFLLQQKNQSNEEVSASVSVFLLSLLGVCFFSWDKDTLYFLPAQVQYDKNTEEMLDVINIYNEILNNELRREKNVTFYEKT